MRRILILAVLFASTLSVGQSPVRWDLGGPIAGVTTTVNQPSVGGQNANYLVTVAPITLAWCSYPANSTQGSPCSNYAVTYTNLTLSTPCPSNQPITLQQSSVCTGASDAYGNLGVNTTAGTYTFTLTSGSTTYGPYTVTLGGGSGSSVLPGTNGQAGQYVGSNTIGPAPLSFTGSNGTFSGNVYIDLGLDIIGGPLTVGTIPTPNPCNGAPGCIVVGDSSGSVIPTAGWITERWVGGVHLCSIDGGVEASCPGGSGGANPGGTVGQTQSYGATSNTFAGTSPLVTTAFNWNQTVTTNLATPGAGQAINLAPCPYGINASGSTTQPYYVYIPTTNAEAALVTGGTCTSGASSDRKSTRLNSSHPSISRMPSSA